MWETVQAWAEATQPEEATTENNGNTNSRKRTRSVSNMDVATEPNDRATRPRLATMTSFENQFSQRRIRRRLERQALVEEAQGIPEETSLPGNRDSMATALKWKGIHERKRSKQQAGNKVSDIGNIKKCVRRKENPSLKQTSMHEYFKK